MIPIMLFLAGIALALIGIKKLDVRYAVSSIALNAAGWIVYFY